MKLDKYLEDNNEHINYGYMDKDDFWNRGICMFTNNVELVVHEKTLEILEIWKDNVYYVKSDYVSKFEDHFEGRQYVVKSLSEYDS